VKITFICNSALAAVFVVFAACGGGSSASPDASADASTEAPPLEPLQTATITATVGSTRFVTREHFLASGEMQISGEPFAEDMGRALAGFSRDHVPPDLYTDPKPGGQGPWIDLAGFSTAVESYEYSKQPMNQVAFESGAGTSLVYGPLVNPGNAAHGAAATALLAARVQHFAEASNALGTFVFPAGTFPVQPQMLLGVRGPGDANPLGAGTGAENPLGWPGIWPTTHVFESFDPTVDPTGDVKLSCAISSDDDPGASGALDCADYECDATTLHLRDRAGQIEPVITPGADGFSAWKYGLWVINYLQIMHDAGEAAVSRVADSDLAGVGAVGNQIVGADATGAATAPGTFLGSSDIEGFQAQMFLQEADDRAADWLANLTTADGATLSGFATLADALAYDYLAPLRWFPGEVKVTESDDGSGFPMPAYSLGSASSDLLDLVGLAMGYAEIYALTDTRNASVGGSQPVRAMFDGDPFPADDQKADGEATLHDRALGMIRVALVDLDRLHSDPTTGVLVDDVTMSGTAPARGTTTSTTSVAYAILGLRTVLRSTSSQLQLYSNNVPDTAITSTPLDALPTHHPSGATFTQRMRAILRAEGELLYDHLTDATGRAYAGWDVTAQAPTDDGGSLDAHTAALRGLFATYLATGDVKYRERAVAVYQRLDALFYDAGARIYSATPAPVDSVDYGPLRFALLQSALRDVYELVAAQPGQESLRLTLASRVSRLNKLVLNGWDDRNENRLVEWPNECVNVQDGLPRGGLQMAERTLSGEIGSYQEQLPLGATRTPTSDREHDCVPEIDDAHLPSALASRVTFHITRP
jgi:hypothetical protein